MRQSGTAEAPDRRRVWRLGLFALLRIALSLTVLFTAYFVIPSRSFREGPGVAWLVLQLAVFAVIVGIQIPIIIRAKRPILRAVETAALIVPLHLLVFARIYVSISLAEPAAFNERLDDVTSLYFTVTVFSTVGFGDIAPKTESMRLLVTVQMLLNLVVLGMVIRVLAAAARRGVARRGIDPDRPVTEPLDGGTARLDRTDESA